MGHPATYVAAHARLAQRAAARWPCAAVRWAVLPVHCQSGSGHLALQRARCTQWASQRGMCRVSYGHVARWTGRQVLVPSTLIG